MTKGKLVTNNSTKDGGFLSTKYLLRVVGEREREEGEKERNAQILYRIPKGQTLPDSVQGGEKCEKSIIISTNCP